MIRPEHMTRLELWQELDRLRAALDNIVRTEVLTTVDQIKSYAETVLGADKGRRR